MPGTPLLLCLWLCNDYIQLIMRYFNGKVDCLYFMLSWDFLKELIDLPILIRLGTPQVAQCLLIWWSLSVILLKLRYLAMLSAVYRKLFISFFVISVMYVESFFSQVVKAWSFWDYGDFIASKGPGFSKCGRDWERIQEWSLYLGLMGPILFSWIFHSPFLFGSWEINIFACLPTISDLRKHPL